MSASMKAKQKYQDPGGRHIRVYGSLLNSPAYRVMGFAAKSLYFDLREKVTGTNNGNISAALSDMKHKGWTSSATLAKALYELRAMGFLALTVEGGLKQGRRAPSLYRFTDLETFLQAKVGVQPVKATHDYLSFKTLGEAQQWLEQEVGRLHQRGKDKQQPKKNLPVQILNASSSVSEAQSTFSASENEQGCSPALHKMNRSSTKQDAAKPA
jgi:hypothetical protein